MKIPELKKYASLGLKIKTKPLVVSAGMPRSGSTLLFNILREIMESKWGNGLTACWNGDLDDLKAGDAYLIKTHKLNGFFQKRAQHIFYTYRDVRVAAVSQHRKFDYPISLDLIYGMLNEYKRAKDFGVTCIRYEDMIQEPRKYIVQIAEKLGISADIDAVYAQSVDLKPPEGDETYSSKTLLHKGHFTNTKDDEWREVFDPELQSKIHEKFGWWFEECGYPVD